MTVLTEIVAHLKFTQFKISCWSKLKCQLNMLQNRRVMQVQTQYKVYKNRKKKQFPLYMCPNLVMQFGSIDHMKKFSLSSLKRACLFSSGCFCFFSLLLRSSLSRVHMYTETCQTESCVVAQGLSTV